MDQGKGKFSPGEQDGSIEIDYDLVRKAIILLDALNNPLSNKIFDVINRQGASTAAEIQLQIKPAINQQLSVLLAQGLLETDDNSGVCYYTVNHRVINTVKDLISLFLSS